MDAKHEHGEDCPGGHGRSHDHGHGGHGHGGHGHGGLGHRDHGHGTLNERRLGLAALLTGGFMVVEVIGGVLAGSLALLADAGHMLSDFASLSLAWLAFRISRRPADWKRTYGFDRFQILVAFVNGTTLFFIAAWILVEAFDRLLAPMQVLGGPMLIVAAAGLAVNLFAFFLLHGADRDNLNVRGATLHVMGDLLGSAAAVVAAGIIIATGWMAADPLLSVLVALIILRSAWYVVRDSGHILLEGTPEAIDPRAIKADLMANVAPVTDIHHVHAWSITQSRPMVTLHARVDNGAVPERVTAEIKARLSRRFGVAHATVEIEHDECADEREGTGAGSRR